MRNLNVSKVYYSTHEGTIVCEKVKDMLSIQASYLTKHMYNLNNKNKIINTNEYFENLLINNLPDKIKKYNLECFIKHNLINVLPTHKYEIFNNIILQYLLIF